VLEGSVRRAGTRVRVTAQLVDAANGFQLWSERYDRQIEDIFNVQDEIARAIVERLKVAFDSSQSPRLVKATTNNMEAYQEYLKGRAMLYRRGPWIARAQEAFQKAVTLDPGYAQAWAGMADAHTTLAYYGYRRPTDTMPTAVEAATRATAIDPESAEAHNALAVAALLWERDFSKAERAFREALTLNPHTRKHAAGMASSSCSGVSAATRTVSRRRGFPLRTILSPPTRQRFCHWRSRRCNGSTKPSSRGTTRCSTIRSRFSRSGSSLSRITGRASMKRRSLSSSRCGPAPATTG
jgi:hypothetical protein